jgi:hypothetical protein
MHLRLPLIMVAAALVAADAKKDDHAHALPHPNDPVLRAEHMDFLGLIPDAAITHTVARDGLWSDKNTWKDGVPPTADANVLVPKDRTVTLDCFCDVALRTVRVDGKLQFAHDRNTALLVDTLLVLPTGRLVIGTAAQPITADKQAKLIFADRGPIDVKWDPHQLSRGLISHGAVIMYGAPTTAHVALAAAPRKGDIRMQLAQQPLNWNKGDRLILPSATLQAPDEELTILAIDGKEATVAPLAHDHAAPAEGLSVPLANLTRNIVIASQNAKDSGRAGHVMFMHSPTVNINNVAFHDLGRTDKRKPINDPKLDEQKHVKDGSGTNPRGRYAVHFHRAGIDSESCPSFVKGCVVHNSPGWGFVNHSSFVEFENNVAFNVTGAAFVTEAGDEIGAFRGNLAIRSAGSGHDVESRRSIQDFGHEGDGFWFQGGGVDIENNIACGHAQVGFIFFTNGLEQEGLGITKFAAANLPNAAWAHGAKVVSVGQVPVRSFKGNVVFASHTGIVPRHHLSHPKDGGPRYPGVTLLADSVVWNTQVGVHVRYSSNITLRNLRLIGNPSDKHGQQTAVLGQIEEVNRIRCENLHVTGWRAGVDVRESGSWVIDGGFYDNQINILVPTTIERGRTIEITGAIRFAEPAKPNSNHYDIYLAAEFRTVFQGRDPNSLFEPDVITFKGKQLYYLEQAADFVPLRKKVERSDDKMVVSADGKVPAELLDKTNNALWKSYGLAIAGAVAPAGAVTEPRLHALIGPPINYPQPAVRFPSMSKQLRGFKLACTGPDKKLVAESPPTDLRQGWNLITIPIEDHLRSFLVFGGTIAAPDKKYEK